jgi:hypothetical protein
MEHGDMDMEYGDMETWKHGKKGGMETWRHRNMETWRHANMQKEDMET